MYIFDGLWIFNDLEKCIIKTLQLKHNFYNKQTFIIILSFNVVKSLILHNIKKLWPNIYYLLVFLNWKIKIKVYYILSVRIYYAQRKYFIFIRVILCKLMLRL